MKIQQTNISQFFSDLTKLQNIKAVLLYGTEEALILDYVLTIKKIKKGLLFETIDAENESCLQNLQMELTTESMFGDSKLLYINNFKKTDGKKLTEIFKHLTPESSNFVIITSLSGLDTTNTVRKMFETIGHFASIGVYAESDATLKILAKSTMDSLKLQYSPAVPELISHLFSNNRSVLKQEIYKLYTYSLNKNEVITEQIAMSVLSEQEDLSIFELQTTIFEKNIQRTLHLLNNAQANEMHPTIIFATIAGYVKKLYAIKKAIMKNTDTIENLMRNNGVFFAQAPTMKKHLNAYSITQIIKILSKLNTLEIQTRSSITLAYNHIKHFAIQQCQ